MNNAPRAPASLPVPRTSRLFKNRTRCTHSLRTSFPFFLLFYSRKARLKSSCINMAPARASFIRFGWDRWHPPLAPNNFMRCMRRFLENLSLRGDRFSCHIFLCSRAFAFASASLHAIRAPFTSLWCTLFPSIACMLVTDLCYRTDTERSSLLLTLVTRRTTTTGAR